MGTLEELLRGLCDDRQPNGNPIKGKLKSLSLSTSTDGWQSIAEFWFYPKWNVCVASDPVAAVSNVLSRGPEESPEKTSLPSPLIRGDLAASDPNMVGGQPSKADDDLSDLLV